MKLVIDISEELYNATQTDMYRLYTENTCHIVLEAIKNGTMLPKGHGRLIDADKLIDSLGASDRDIYCKSIIEEDAATIIEADKVT